MKDYKKLLEKTEEILKNITDEEHWQFIYDYNYRMPPDLQWGLSDEELAIINEKRKRDVNSPYYEQE